jgi:hypothetical protein
MRGRGSWAVPAVCAAIAVALGAGAAAAVTDRQGVTVLVHMTHGDPMSALAPRPFTFVQDTAHYDGVYFYAIARDPFARGAAHRLIDLSAYRYGHPGYGWMAWLASGGGRPRAVPYALLFVSLLGLGVAGAAAAVLARDLAMSAWWGLSIALNPGLIFAVTSDTSETVELAAALLTILLWLRGRRRWAGVAIAVGCFTKEPLLLVPAAIFAWEALGFAFGRRPTNLRERLGALLAGPMLYAIWALYCRHVLGGLPSSQVDQLTYPFTGWIQTIHKATAQMRRGDAQIGMVTVAFLVPVGGLLLLGLVRALRLRGPLDAIFVGLAALVFCTNWLVLLYPKDLIRLVALPLALLPFVLAGTARPRQGEPFEPL